MIIWFVCVVISVARDRTVHHSKQEQGCLLLICLRNMCVCVYVMIFVLMSLDISDPTISQRFPWMRLHRSRAWPICKCLQIVIVFDCFVLLFDSCVLWFCCSWSHNASWQTRLLADDLLVQMRVWMCDGFCLDELRDLYWNLITAIPVDAFASLTSLTSL